MYAVAATVKACWCKVVYGGVWWCKSENIILPTESSSGSCDAGLGAPLKRNSNFCCAAITAASVIAPSYKPHTSSLRLEAHLRAKSGSLSLSRRVLGLGHSGQNNLHAFDRNRCRKVPISTLKVLLKSCMHKACLFLQSTTSVVAKPQILQAVTAPAAGRELQLYIIYATHHHTPT
jgi:hypothetical protein